MELITHVIDGEDVESESGAKFDSVDPYTRAAYAEVALGGQTEVDRAVAVGPPSLRRGPVAADGLRRARRAAAPAGGPGRRARARSSPTRT